MTAKTPNVIMAISIITMFITVAYAAFVPVKTAKGIAKSRTILLDSIDADIKRLESSKSTALKVNQLRLISGDTNAVTSELMRIALITAKQYQLELSSVRPQRISKLGIVDESAFAIQLTGSSKGVVGAIRSLDSPQSRFVVRSVQLSPLDTAGVATVSANIVVVGYQASTTETSKATTQTTKGTSKK
jgi:hypothetical protein